MRMSAYNLFLKTAKNYSEMEKVIAVNIFINLEIRYKEDISLYFKKDYWATPKETLLSGLGDCEDYAIVKYFTLKGLGVGMESLALVYSKYLNYNNVSSYHMVLAYFEHYHDPLVLDNITDIICPISEKSELVPLFYFDEDFIYRVKDSVKEILGDSSRLRAWKELLEKIERGET